MGHVPLPVETRTFPPLRLILIACTSAPEMSSLGRQVSSKARVMESSPFKIVWAFFSKPGHDLGLSMSYAQRPLPVPPASVRALYVVYMYLIALSIFPRLGIAKP